MIIGAWNLGKKPPYDAKVEYLGMGSVLGKPYVEIASISSLPSGTVASGDVVSLAFRARFSKPQNGRNFIASLGRDSYFHYTEIRNSRIGGYAYGREVAFFDYSDDYPVGVSMIVSLGSFDCTFDTGGQPNVLHYAEDTTAVFPVTIGALIGISSYPAATMYLEAATLTVNGTVERKLIPVRKDGVGYMYDVVSGELLGNAGTGTFTIGPDKS